MVQGVTIKYTLLGSSNPSWGTLRFKESRLTRGEIVAGALLSASVPVFMGAYTEVGSSSKISSAET